MGTCKPSRDAAHSDKDEVQLERNPSIGVHELKPQPDRYGTVSSGRAGWRSVSGKVRTAGTVSRAASAAHSRQQHLEMQQNTTEESSDSTYSGTNSANSVTPREKCQSDCGVTPRPTQVARDMVRGRCGRRSSLPNENMRDSPPMGRRNIGMDVPVQHKGVHQKNQYMTGLDSRLSSEVERKKAARNGDPDSRFNNKKKKGKKDNQRRKKPSIVSFCEVELFEFARAAHEAAPTPKSGGPGLGMGWAAIATAKIKITEFEKMRCNTRTPRQKFHREGRLTPKERSAILNVHI